MNPRGALDLRIPSDVQHIAGIVAEVVRACEAFAFPRRALQLNVPVALTEALSNAILRGNGEDAHKEVQVHAVVTDAALVMEVMDQGEAFDLAACTTDPGAPENLEREDGRGLFLMQKLMDRVEQYRRPGKPSGNVVRLTLRRYPA